ncbi:MAG: DNA gyrase subunit A, partial [Myxococcales bacterium]|nr:DNA gyrase subunit A [Myxococcales bacterium]
FGVNMLSIVDGQPRLLNLKDTLEHFIAHRREVVTRRTRFDLRKALEHLEIVEGLGMAVTEVDLVVNTIRSSKDPEAAREALMKLPIKGLEEFVKRAGRPDNELAAARERGDYFLSERQAKAILEMRLARLTGLEREKLATEYGDVCDVIARLREILGSDEKLMQVVVDELQEVRERYGDKRRTEIMEAEGEIGMEDLIADEDVVVTVSHHGYIKRVPITEYRSQGRGGKGTRAMDTRDEDFVSNVFVATNHAHVLFFSDKGKVYLKKIFEIPQSARTARGRAIVNFVGMEADDKVAAVVPVPEFKDDAYLMTCTVGGRVKRTELSKYANIRQTGIIGVAIEDGDSLLGARVVESGHQALLSTAAGMSVRFNVEDARPMGRDSRGVKGIDLREGDRVVGFDVATDDNSLVLAVSENGYGKRTELSEWRIQNRGGKGIIAMDTSERNGPLVKLRLVAPGDQLMVITDGGQVIRTRCDEIRIAGRNTQGVRIIRLGEGEKVVDVEPVAIDEDEEAETVSVPPPDEGDVSQGDPAAEPVDDDTPSDVE